MRCIRLKRRFKIANFITSIFDTVPKNKLKRFADNHEFSNVVEAGYEEVFQKDHPLKGKWHREFFKNDNPLVLELGCGRGEYTIGMARRFPDKNFLGVDIKGARIWYGATAAQKEGLDNAGFLRTRIDFISSFFAENEVSEIWITFPDPQPKSKQARKRLTGPMFTDRYRGFLKSDGVVHLKTDNPPFFDFTLECIEENNWPTFEMTRDLHGGDAARLTPPTQELLGIRTYYESIWIEQGLNIHYVKFALQPS